MELEINMYVRTDKGRIGKVVSEKYEYRDDYNQKIKFKDEIEFIWDMDWEDILEASYKIVELIHSGDYVNGKQVDYISVYNDVTILNFVDGSSCSSNEIYDIVTREQFENEKYKVGE